MNGNLKFVNGNGCKKNPGIICMEDYTGPSNKSDYTFISSSLLS